MTTRLALCLGLTRLDPAAYGGWDGECPGCDRDAARFATLCHDIGFDGVTVLINRAVTARRVASAFELLRRDLRAGDLLVLYNSGHGGQQPDRNGDELDGCDETLCWWDGEVRDDAIERYLLRLRKGVRVLFVSDTCNSGTSYRGVPQRLNRGRRSTPVRLPEPVTFRAGLVHFGGCEDGRSSFGTEEGGVWTLALLEALSRAKRPLAYCEWFARAAREMDAEQRPVYSEWGKPFGQMEAFT
ncbi:MAG: hypothetical protein A2W31_15220 [Planctomycetes bacterium RBG_16_64_10]|nr:MAG: hypothetical protein A2W31_15220 [Planctomycetes bacterium RBG_16_64_10]